MGIRGVRPITVTMLRADMGIRGVILDKMLCILVGLVAKISSTEVS